MVVGGLRIEEPNSRIYFSNSSKERQMNYKDYAHLRRIKDPVGSRHPQKNSGQGNAWQRKDTRSVRVDEGSFL